MAIQELPVFPDTTLSEGQGLVGIRKWALDANDDVGQFLGLVSRSHWPNRPDCIPIQIESGAFWDGTVLQPGSMRTTATLGDLPNYGKYLVVAHYLLHRMTNCWPYKIPKPWHPPGTTLSLKVKGSGQYLVVSPAGMHGALTPASPCSNGNIATEALSPNITARIVIPVTEYHVSCDRMTLDQVNAALATDWDDYQGCVNDIGVGFDKEGNHFRMAFMGAPRGTLLFDGYEIEETFACDYCNPLRYRMTACLKQRIILDKNGKPKVIGPPGEDINGNPLAYPVGWNHDFINSATITKKGDKKPASANDKPWAWRIILMMDDNGQCLPRYYFRDFTNLFGNASGHQNPADCNTEGSDGTSVGDDYLCRGGTYPGGSETPSIYDPEVGSVYGPDESYENSKTN